MLLLEGAIWLTLFAAVCFLYLNFRALQGAREIAIQSEEHQLLLQLARSSLNLGRNDEYQFYLWQEYENARWLQKMYHLLTLSRPMQFMLFGNFLRSPPVAGHILTRSSEFLLVLVQDHLRKSIPAELERLLNWPDKQAAASELMRLVTVGYYAKLFDNWIDGKQACNDALADQVKREKLAGLFKNIEELEPRLRNQQHLRWIVISEP